MVIIEEILVLKLLNNENYFWKFKRKKNSTEPNSKILDH